MITQVIVGAIRVNAYLDICAVWLVQQTQYMPSSSKKYL